MARQHGTREKHQTGGTQQARGLSGGVLPGEQGKDRGLQCGVPAGEQGKERKSPARSDTPSRAAKQQESKQNLMFLC